MPLQVHRMSDCNTGDGCITIIPQSTVFANNLLVCVNGSIGTSHSSCGSPGGDVHCEGNWITTSGGPTVFAEGIPVNKMSDPDSCGHTRAAGSPDVFML